MRVRMIGTVAATLLVASFASFGPPAFSAEPDGRWQHTLIVYGMGAAIDGEAQVGDLTVPVEVSISELFDLLEFGAMGAYRASNGTWTFILDSTFMGLGGTSDSKGGRVTGDLDLDQLTVMGTVGRRVARNLDILFSLAYFDLSTGLELRIKRPISGEVVKRTASTDVNWIDPLVGLQYTVPFCTNWRFGLRGDIGGFGIGSELTYQLLANFHWQANRTLGLAFGYRVIGFDYEEGGGKSYQRYDLVEQGPLAGLTISF